MPQVETIAPWEGREADWANVKAESPTPGGFATRGGKATPRGDLFTDGMEVRPRPSEAVSELRKAAKAIREQRAAEVAAEIVYGLICDILGNDPPSADPVDAELRKLAEQLRSRYGLEAHNHARICSSNDARSNGVNQTRVAWAATTRQHIRFASSIPPFGSFRNSPEFA